MSEMAPREATEILNQLQAVPLSRRLAAALQLFEHDDAGYYTLLRVGHVLSWGSIEQAVRHVTKQPNAATPLALALFCQLSDKPVLPFITPLFPTVAHILRILEDP